MSNNQKEENKESTTFTFGKITYEVIFAPQLTGKDKKAREFLKKHPIPKEFLRKK